MASGAASGRSDATPSAPLDAATRARGRRLAIVSHPAGMIHRTSLLGELPTLALVALGASETLVGVQRAFGPASALLQLPTLRAVGRIRKRSLLVAGQTIALLGGLPLAAFAALSALRDGAGIAVVLLCLAVVSVGASVGDTVWFPLLRGYVEPDRVGRFFAALRTGWHLTLILYFLGAQRWLAAHPGDFGPLFAFGALCGALRIALIARLPERSERTGERIRVREALGLVRGEPLLRRYLASVCLRGALERTTVPFAIVMMRRGADFSEAEVLLTTVASYAGGLSALLVAGRAVDRAGPAPVLRATSLGLGAVLLLFLLVREPGPGTVALAAAVFFTRSALSTAFGVADTDVLFNLAPAHAPARLIVAARVIQDVSVSAAPILVGVGIEAALARVADPLDVYHGFFVVAAALSALVFLPLRRFERRPDPEG